MEKVPKAVVVNGTHGTGPLPCLYMLFNFDNVFATSQCMQLSFFFLGGGEGEVPYLCLKKKGGEREKSIGLRKKSGRALA